MAKKFDLALPDTNNNEVGKVAKEIAKRVRKPSNKSRQEIKNEKITLSLSANEKRNLVALSALARHEDKSNSISGYICDLIDKESKRQADKIKAYYDLFK